MHLIQLKHQSVCRFTLINIIHLWFRWRHTISIWITLPKCLNQFRINKPDTIHLVAQCYPKQKNKHYSSITLSFQTFLTTCGKVFYLYPWTPSLSILFPSVPPGKPMKAMTFCPHCPVIIPLATACFQLQTALLNKSQRKCTYQFGWTLCGRPNNSIFLVPGERRSMIP